MALFQTARDLARHQDSCERATEEARREQRDNAAETRRTLERMQDQFASGIKDLRTDMLRMHQENKSDTKALWRTLWVGLGTITVILISALGALAAHGGLRGLMQDF